MTATNHNLLVADAIAEFTALFRTWPGGRRAITIGGSTGKGLADTRSDLDFRIFHEEDLPWPDRDPGLWKPLWPLIESWKSRGVTVDGVWPRRIADLDTQLQRWLDGHLDVAPKEWSVWGYHLPTDIFNQHIIEDESGIIARWRGWLTPYPPKLKAAILAKHGGSLRYWRNDYHYENKVARRDPVFLAGLSARLVHDVMQVLFALNETYFPGDGANLLYAEKFTVRPADLAPRVTAILYPAPGDDVFARQHNALLALIDDTLALHPTDSSQTLHLNVP